MAEPQGGRAHESGIEDVGYMGESIFMNALLMHIIAGLISSACRYFPLGLH